MQSINEQSIIDIWFLKLNLWIKNCIKRIINRAAIVGLADGEMSVDDRKIYTAEKLKVGLFRDPSKF